MPKKATSSLNEGTTDLKITFEDAYRELEEIVVKLEKGDLSLEQALELHERGSLLSEYCSVQLDRAEVKIKKLDISSVEAD